MAAWSSRRGRSWSTEFERQQAAATLPAITETATLRRIADQAAAAAEASASKAPIDQQEERQAEAIARAAEAANLVIPPVPRWLVDDATPEALAGLLATYGRIALLSPEGDVFDQMAGRYNQTAGPNLGVYLKGHAGDLLKVDRRGRPPEYVERPCLTIGLTVQPEVLQGLELHGIAVGHRLWHRWSADLAAADQTLGEAV